VTLSVKDRVFAAAEQISAERRPTVSTVRALAGVSNADATRYLKEWAEEKSAAGGQVAAAPAALLEQAARLGGACWAEASTLADARHAAAEAGWVQEKKDLGLEVAELVADLDKVSAGKDAAVTELTAGSRRWRRRLPRRGSSWRRPGRRSRKRPGRHRWPRPGRRPCSRHAMRCWTASPLQPPGLTRGPGRPPAGKTKLFHRTSRMSTRGRGPAGGSFRW
jgi:hypothetical protein